MSKRDEFEERHRSALLHDKNFAFKLWQRVEALEAENERLRSLAVEATDEIEAWAGYASDYFKDKHGFVEIIADLRARAALPHP